MYIYIPYLWHPAFSLSPRVTEIHMQICFLTNKSQHVCFETGKLRKKTPVRKWRNVPPKWGEGRTQKKMNHHLNQPFEYQGIFGSFFRERNHFIVFHERALRKVQVDIWWILERLCGELRLVNQVGTTERNLRGTYTCSMDVNFFQCSLFTVKQQTLLHLRKRKNIHITKFTTHPQP